VTRALITGVLGQDGSYLAEQLLGEGHEVFGLTRRVRAQSPAQLILGDLLDQDSLEAALRKCKPDVVYNLAAVTAPGQGWGMPQPPLLAEVTGLGVVKLLEAMVRCTPNSRLVHASSSAIYDQARYGLYGIAKVFAHRAVQGYRQQLHCSNAVLFSHTSPRQDPRFLAPRIFSTIGRIAAGSKEHLVLGDVESRRDWGYAPDYMRALPLVAERDTPGDWVIATGVSHSVRDLTEAALKAAGLTWDEAVDIDPGVPRVPHEVIDQDGRLFTAAALGWKPQTSLDQLAELMIADAMLKGW
jgi:GDPmannose 4,6-dehydratase